MTRPPASAPDSPRSSRVSGDVSALATQVSSPDLLGLVRPADAHQLQSSAALKAFVNDYLGKILELEEWPLICRAYEMARRGETRELIELDAECSNRYARHPGASASLRVGQRQLSKLRPMRDSRLVQRYLAAIAAGEASGWHAIVYGVTLAMFQLPLRQGLIHYAVQTLKGFVGPLHETPLLTGQQKETVLAEAEAALPSFLQRVLPGGDSTPLRAV